MNLPLPLSRAGATGSVTLSSSAAAEGRGLSEAPMRGTIEERFWAKVHKTPTCWLWTAYTNIGGYGQLYQGPQSPIAVAHRFAYELLRGNIPEGLTLDHLCRVRNCVNPDHLEPVTLAENTLRGIGPTATNARKEQCKRGHPLSAYNSQPNQHLRRCRECAKLHRVAYSTKRREAR